MLRRALFLALFAYFTLDVALPMLPGAFVFAPEVEIDTLDNFQNHRGRSVIVLPAFTSALSVRTEPAIDVSDTSAPTNESMAGSRVVTRLPRATLDPPPSPEDSH